MDTTQMVVVGLIVLVVLGFIVWPMIARGRRPVAAGAHAVDENRIEARIADYRAALRRDTVCGACLYANAEDARFCAECGARLSGSAAS